MHNIRYYLESSIFSDFSIIFYENLGGIAVEDGGMEWNEITRVLVQDVLCSQGQSHKSML